MNVNPKRFFSRFGQLSWQSSIKEAQRIKYRIPIRNTNQTDTAPAMVQTQEEAKEEIERISSLEEIIEEIHAPREEINEENTEERRKKIHSPMEDTFKKTLEERKEEIHSPMEGTKEITSMNQKNFWSLKAKKFFY